MSQDNRFANRSAIQGAAFYPLHFLVFVRGEKIPTRSKSGILSNLSIYCEIRDALKTPPRNPDRPQLATPKQASSGLTHRKQISEIIPASHTTACFFQAKPKRYTEGKIVSGRPRPSRKSAGSGTLAEIQRASDLSRTYSAPLAGVSEPISNRSNRNQIACKSHPDRNQIATKSQQKTNSDAANL